METRSPVNKPKESFLLGNWVGSSRIPGGKRWQTNLLFDFLDRGFFIFINVENLVQSHQLKDFFYVITDSTKAKFHFCFFAFFAKQDQFSDHCRRHKADVLEIQYDTRVAGVVDQFTELLSEAADSRIIDDSNILKVNDKDVVAFEAVDQCHDFFLLDFQAVCNFELI
ncbi:hypothetical protein N9Z58_01940 [bacterium]|nr:hypothetical protein [bacterium]MDB4460654.1 hypothetical protein [bacterium]